MESQKLPFPRLQWSVEEACERLIKAFDLEKEIQEEKKAHAAGSSVIQEAAEAVIKSASPGGVDGPLQSHHFDGALRNFALAREKVAGLVPNHVLERALLSFYLEVAGVDMSTITNTLPETATNVQYLDDLMERGLIHFRDSKRILFFFIVETCKPSVEELILKHNFHLGKAVRDGLGTSIISRSQANLAEFCLLTGLGTTEARRHEADIDLPGAVQSVLSLRDNITLLQRTARCSQAKLFLFPSSEEHI